MKILLVDDNVMVHPLVKHMFKEHECDAFETAEEAKKSLKKKKYDVAIIDVRLKSYDGYSLAAYMRTTLKLDTKIVMYSALPRENFIGDEYVQKGHPGDLERAICKLCEINCNDCKYKADKR